MNDNNVYDFLSHILISFLRAISIYIKIHSATYNHKKALSLMTVKLLCFCHIFPGIY